MSPGAAAVLVDQLLPQIMPRDAVSNHTRGMHAALARLGVAGRIWSGWIDPALGDEVRPWRTFDRDRRAGGGVLLYQAFMRSPGLVRFLRSRPEPLAVYYHNITPGPLLRAYDPVAATAMDEARDELRRLMPRVRLALAASAFSAEDLRGWGVADVRVLPPYRLAPGPGPVDAPYLEQLRAAKRGPAMLFVGRVAPHKGHRHLLAALAALRAGGQTSARLAIVGPPGPPPYMLALRAEVSRLRLDGAVELAGSVSDAQLAAHYAAADVFVCLSEHEGYCLPIVEAMRAGLPVVAFAAGAVPETLGGAGVTLATLDPLVVAEVVARVCADGDLRAALLARQSERVAELDRVDRDAELLAAVRALAGESPAGR